MVQYLRWQCRLKVGHTKSIAVFSEDLTARRPLLELEAAASFAGLKPDRKQLLEVLQAEGHAMGFDYSGLGGSIARGRMEPQGGEVQGSIGSLPDPWQHHSSELVAGDPFATFATAADSMEMLPSPSRRRQHQLGSKTGGSSWARQRLPWPASMPLSVAEQLLDAFEAEMRRSASLQKWPCGSIRNDATPLGALLVPNCSSAFGVRCFAGGDNSPGEFVS